MRRVTNYKSDVRQILDGMMKNLMKGERRFVFHDIAFLKMYWRELGDDQKDLFRLYVQAGRLEVAGCSISMNDFLLPKDDDIVSNFVAGRKWWEENRLGKWSKTAWTIDVFGMQPKNIFQFSRLGIKNLVTSRVPYSSKSAHLVNRLLVFNWLEPVSGSKVRTALTPVHYSGFKVIANPHSKWVFDNPLDDKKFNIFTMFNATLNYYEKVSRVFKHGIVFDLYGDDFSHMDFDATIGSYEKLIAFNRYNPLRSQGFKFKFSTATELFDDLEALNLTYSIETPQFSPYIDQPNDFWVGYYSTHPHLKNKISSLLESWNSIKKIIIQDLYSSKRNDTRAFDSDDNLADQDKEEKHKEEILMDEVDEECGKLIHHDAITGTSTDDVVRSYLSSTYKVQNKIQRYLYSSRSIRTHILTSYHLESSFKMLDYYVCNWEPHKWCIFASPPQNMNTLSVIFNPSSEQITFTDELYSISPNYEILNSNGIQVESMMSCFENKKPGSTPFSRCKLTFESQILPNSLSSHRIVPTPDPRSKNLFVYEYIKGCKQLNLNPRMNIRVFCTNNPFKLEINQISKKDISLMITLREYLTIESGHYIFKPAKGTIHGSRFLQDNKLVNIAVVRTPHYTDIRYIYTAGTLSIIFKNVHNEKTDDGFFVSVEFDLKPQEISKMNEQKASGGRDNQRETATGKEFVIDIRTNHTNNDRFYYSQNGEGYEESVKHPKFKVDVEDEIDEYNMKNTQNKQGNRV